VPATPAEVPRLATRANAVTALRLLCAPVVALGLACGAPDLAGLAFAVAVASDLLDGRVARRYGESTALGGLFDHASDAAFVSAGLAALAARGEVPAPLPLLVAAAFVQYALDSRAAAGRPLRGSPLGRWNGIAYYALLGVPVVRDAAGLGWPPAPLVWALGLGLCATTVVSMLDRLRTARRAPPAR
jgi:phosphatidylglycerophosphate synthase